MDEGAPDSNFGTETELRVRSESGANKRSYIEFDMDQLPDNFDAFDDPLSVIVQVVEESGTERTIKLDEVTGDFDEATLTWNTQPTIGLEGIGSRTSNPDELNYDLLGLVPIIPTSGPFRVRLRDGTEDELVAARQRLASREHATEAAPVFRIGYIAAESRDLSSSLTVQKAATANLTSDVRPRILAEADLAASLDVVYVGDLVATVTPALTPLETRARVQGIITHLFLEPLEDFRRITDEAGSLVTRVQGGETEELRRIVQVVASGTPAFSLSEAPTFPGAETGTPDTLRRGDAILFALGGETWHPGATVTWDGQSYAVAGVLGTERVEGELLYQEIGLRRLGVTAQGRAKGAVA